MGDMVMDKTNGKNTNGDASTPTFQESYVKISFSSIGSVIMTLDFKNVIPLQVAAAAWLLEKQAESGFFQQQMEQQQRAEQQKIAVPELAVRKTIIKP
jgi:hypothetical protein